MSALDSTSPEDDEPPIVLSRDELQILRYTCELFAEDESPLGRLDPDPDPEALQHAAHALVARGLADAQSYRPDRELVRRLLIVSEPDARIVLFRSGPERGENLIDLYERAGAHVRFRRDGDRYELGKPMELDTILAEVLGHFHLRRSTGDYVELGLSSLEYFAFSLLAGDLRTRARAGQVSARGQTPASANAGLPTMRLSEAAVRRAAARQGPDTIRLVAGALEAPVSSGLGGSRAGEAGPTRADRVPSPSGLGEDEGTPIYGLLRRLAPEPNDQARRSLPGDAEWHRALDALVAKDVASRVGDRYVLRPYLHDLALGLATKRRTVLTRFDFGAEDWVTRDATFITVPGSVFLVRSGRGGAIRVVELDERALAGAVRFAIEPIGDRAPIEAGPGRDPDRAGGSGFAGPGP